MRPLRRSGIVLLLFVCCLVPSHAQIRAAFVAYDSFASSQLLNFYLSSDPRFSLAKSAFFGFTNSADAPTLAQLNTFDVVFTWSNGITPSSAYGDVLKSYVNGGGGVVLATFGFLSGNGAFSGGIQDPGYSPLEVGNNNFTGSTLGTFNAAHPIFNGVKSISAITFSGDADGLDNGATLLGSWANGRTLVAINATNNVAAVTLYPNSLRFGHAGGDYIRFYDNALAFVARPAATVPEPGFLTLLSGSVVASLMVCRKRTLRK